MYWYWVLGYNINILLELKYSYLYYLYELFFSSIDQNECINYLLLYSYRNSFFHNLCTDVLEEGYHLAFRELFNLVREAQELTAADENASHKKQQIPLEENEEKLTYLKEMLVKVEVLKRQGLHHFILTDLRENNISKRSALYW